MDRPPVTLLRADARTIPLADNTVDLVVTSPPYWALRSYTDGGEHYAGQIGDEPTPREFVDALIDVTRECMRVLKPAGSLFMNLGDKYAASERGPDGSSSGLSNGPQFRVGSGRSVAASGVPKKSLMMIPARYSIRCIDELGLILRAQIVWSKTNAMPESVTDRVRRTHEEWFHFVQVPRYYSAVDEIRTPAVRFGARALSRYADGVQDRAYAEHRGLADRPNHPMGSLPGSVWEIGTEPLTVPEDVGVEHHAAFPMEWPRRLINGWCPPAICTRCGQGWSPLVDAVTTGHDNNPVSGRARNDFALTGSEFYRWRTEHPRQITGYRCDCPDLDAPTRPAVVLDPFGGTGTTALVAHALGRRGLSMDMSADYCSLAAWRTTDPGQVAKAMQVRKPKPQVDGQGSLLEMLGDGAA